MAFHAILVHNQLNQMKLSGTNYEVVKSVRKEPESTSFADNQNTYQTLINFNEMTPDSYMTEQQTIIEQNEFEIPLNNVQYCQL